MKKIITIGTKTDFGIVEGITFTGGERYYFIEGKFGTVSMLPANVVEKGVVECTKI